MRLTISILLITLFSACSAPRAPYFKELADVQVQNLSLKNVTLNTQLIYHNPNVVGATVVKSSTDVIVNDINIGKVVQDQKIEVKAKSDFELPVVISFPPSDIFKSKGLLKSALQVLSTDKANVQYKGTMTMAVAGVEFDLPIDYEEEVEIK